MPVRVDAQELNRLLELTPPDQNVMLVGRHGIGKSQIIADHFRRRSMEVVSFFLGQMSDPGDLIGLPHKDPASGRTEFLPPYWWPDEGQPIVLFLDELNRARPEILQAVMELALNKTLAGKRLPAGSVIVSAVNEGDEYQLTDLDPALVSRFNLYEFAPTVDDWLLWAHGAGIDRRVVEFVQSQPAFLDGPVGADGQQESHWMSGLMKTPDRRGWERVSKLIESIPTLESGHIKLVAGIVGSAAATAFGKSVANPLPVSPEEVLLRWEQHVAVLQSMSLADILRLNEQMLSWIASGKCPGASEELARDGLTEYLKLLRRRELEEAVAHLLSLMEKPRFEPAMAFVAQSVSLSQWLANYMESVRIE
ncbi:AAA family ATPase [Roseiconus nitratireducens]|uniref:AAA family ATPase n=1 Tax=Roseiconus nitratireducens TaxID=2605748 RepID=A0A5M6DCR2_9BACT|nr:AAA family ATPase [Roseiconus nitratireducens]KAA5545358.1 AAA family ATPase [Roseiconus nitratireducens]